MKKIKYTLILTLLGLLLALGGCKFDDNIPSSELRESEAITSLSLLETATRGYYSIQATNDNGLAGEGGLYADAKGGDIKYVGTSNNFRPVLAFATSRSSGMAIETYYVYATILGRINKNMTLYDNITDKDKDKDLFTALQGEAYAMRAFAHFEMARTFAQLPVIATDINAPNSGIPIQEAYSDENKVQSRSTLKATYDQIIKDFEKSQTLLPKKSIKELDRTQLNYWAVSALLSRVYLYMGDYNNALKYAIDVIGNSGAELYSIEDYIVSWRRVSQSETLFEIATTEKSNPQRRSLGYQTNPEGYAEAAASDAFMEFFNTLPKEDIRTKMVTKRADAKGKQGGFYTTKYMGQDAVANFLYVNNPKVVRLSEMYLIAAEAVLKGGKAQGAQSAEYYLNELRKNRIEDVTPLTTVTLENILDERRIEFFCENHRMFDLVRNKLDIHSPYVVDPIKYNDNRILAAIPEREINISKGAMVQNPGW